MRRCRAMRIPPPALALCAGAVQRALTRDAPRPTVVRAGVAATVALASTALAGASASLLRRSGTTLDPFDPAQASTLVTTGPNAISRNPMYLGLAGHLVSNAILRGSWTALAPAAAFVLLIDRRQIAAEEAALLGKFGADYEAYRAAVPRWLDRRSLGVLFNL